MKSGCCVQESSALFAARGHPRGDYEVGLDGPGWGRGPKGTSAGSLHCPERIRSTGHACS